MRALVRAESGPPWLELKEIDTPVPKENEVLVRVHATSLNDYDLFIARPTFMFRLVGTLVRAVIPGAPPRVMVPGCDAAGTVTAVGSRVTRFRPGDEVVGDLSRLGFGGFGAFAEYASAVEDALLLKPAGMTFEQAAALPQAGVLAAQGLLANGPLRAGQKILINGAGGGVGTIGVQLAKPHGVEVTGVDHGSKLEMMRRIGFDHVIDYEKEDFTASGRRYDLIVDAKTNRPPWAYMRALKPGGVYATVGGQTARLLQLVPIGWVIGRTTNKKIILITLKQNSQLGYLLEAFEAGHLKPVIDGPYPLGNWRDAFRHFGTARHQGKVIITML